MDYILPHQKAVIKAIKRLPGLIVYHSTGSGKTITSLLSMVQFNKRIIIIGPKSSKKAFVDEMEKLDINAKFVTITFMIKILKYEPNFLEDACVIVDEAHNIRNITKNNRQLWNSLWKVYKVLFLTATLLINHVCDLFVLLNIINKNNNLPVTKIRYEKIKETINFKEEIQNKISWYKASNEDYPTYNRIIKYVYYQKDQEEKYEKYIRLILKDNEGNILPEDLEQGSKWIKKYNNLDSIYELDESIKENSFLSAVRQISNTINSQTNYPKIKKVFETIVQDIKDNKTPIILYSAFLKNGILPIKKLLDENNISNNVISGEKSISNIRETINLYNINLITVLLISAAGSESLNLKNTRCIHILEPFWNKSRITQVIGRAIRYKSHSLLDPNKRNVTIYEWISKFENPKYKYLSADELLLKISILKEKEYDEFNKIIIENSI